MKKILYSVISAMFLFLGSACERDDYEFKQTASITVINAIVDNGPVKVNPGAGSGFAYSKVIDLAYGASGVYGAFTGNNNLTVVKSTDTTKTLFQRTIDLKPISTLYLAGQSPNIDTIFRVENNFPYIQSSAASPDNSIYIRFVNLSPTSTPLNINIRSVTTNEVTALAYKGITDFKKYAALTTTGDYIFEIREASTNTIKATVTIQPNTYRFKTISIVMRGLLTTPATTGTNAFATFIVSYT